MSDSLEQFIHSKNLQHYRKLPAETKDEALRQQIQLVLAEEEATEWKGSKRTKDRVSV